MTRYTRLVLCLLINSNLSLYSSQLITGDSTTSGETTSFAIGAHAFDIFGGALETPSMYIGAGSVVANNTYAIARATRTSTKLEALAPEKITLDNVADQNNPLYGAKIDFLKLSNDNPLVVKNGDKNVYMYSNVISGIQGVKLFSSGEVKDTTGSVTNTILNIESVNGPTGYSFAACTPTGSSTFGGAGSGIALLRKAMDSNNVSTFVLQNDSKASALDTTSASIKIGSDVASLASVVDLHWSGELECLFIGLQTTAGSTSGDGARSIVIGKIKPVSGKTYSEITFESFAPDAIFASSNDKIIGTGTAGGEVSAINLKTLVTSTRINYLIVNGGNGAASTVGNKVYALPLVNDGSTNQGHLAKYDQTPTDTFVAENDMFTKRTLTTAAATASDALTASSTAARVGGGDLPIAASESISDMFTANDSVYVSVGTTTTSSATGIYHSQAILGEDGLVKNWTAWQKVSGFEGKVFGANMDQRQGLYWYLTGASASTVNTIKHTLWGTATKDGLLGGTTSDESVGLIANMSTLFPSTSGGIFKTVNVPKEDPAITTSSNTSLLITTGFGKVAIVNPSAAAAGDFSAGLVESTNDTIPTTNSSSTIVSVTGDNLTDLGPITTANVATASGQSWVVVGGADGVAILRQTSGAGWSGTLSDLSTLTTSLKFEKFGSYKYVKKITSDGTYLYILTEDKLDKIQLLGINLASSTPTIATIAQVGTLTGTAANDSFNDFVVSGHLGLLATSAGLYRVGNSSTIFGTQNWTTVNIPEQGSEPCSQLITVSPTGLESNLVNGGNLYVLSSYRGLHQAQVNRFYVKFSSAISDTTIQPLPDIFKKGTNSFFLDFGSFRDTFFTDGTMLINTLSKDSSEDSYVQLMSPGITSGTNPTIIAKAFKPELSLDSTNFVSNITRSSNSGALLIAGEFGIQANS